MTLPGALALLATMTLLALLPTVSSLAVAARSASHGLAHGLSTAAGVLVGDLVYASIALLGIAAMVARIEPLAIALRVIGGVYLFYVGYRIWRSAAAPRRADSIASAPLWRSFLTGLLITLGDQKAVFFYLVFFPAFLDTSMVGWADLLSVLAITILSVGTAKLCHALLADRAGLAVGTRGQLMVNRLAALALLAVGVSLLAEAFMQLR